MIGLNQLISVARLRIGSRGARGQIATFLLLAIVVMLIFAMVVANLGVSATAATQLTNAADAATLHLGSSLATKGNVLNESLKTAKGKYSAGPPPKSTTKTAGIGVMIVIMVVAIAATIVTAGALAPVIAAAGSAVAAAAATGFVAGAMSLLATTGGMLIGIAVGAAAGAAAGASLGAGLGTGVASGAIQGAMTGAAAGGAVSGVASAFAAPAAAAPATTPAVAGSGGVTVTVGATELGGDAITMTLAEGTALPQGAVLASDATLMVPGAEVGGGFGMVPAGTPITSLPAGAIVTPVAPVAGAPVGVAAAAPVAISTPAATSLISPTVKGVGTATLNIGGELFSKTVDLRIQSDTFSAVAKALNGLPERDRFREQAMFEAFIRTVDDPNTVNDTNDVDRDGDTEEEVPRFAFQWDERVKKLKQEANLIAHGVGDLLQGFVEQQLQPFADTAKQFAAQALSREEVEPAETGEGQVVALARLLGTPARRTDTDNVTPVPVPFWAPGPTAEALNAWRNDPDENAAPPAGYDSLDAAIDTLRLFPDLVNGDAQEGAAGLVEMGRGQRFATRDLWSDPSAIQFYVDQLEDVITGNESTVPPLYGLKPWQAQLLDVQERLLPACGLTHDGTTLTVQHAPCAIAQPQHDSLAAELAQTQRFLDAPPVSDIISLELGKGLLTYIHQVPCGEGDSCDVTGTQPVTDAGVTMPAMEPAQFQRATTALQSFAQRIAVPYGSSDADEEDEFAQAHDAIEGFIQTARAFQDTLRGFSTALQGADTPMEDRASGVNPASYTWKDSRGEHAVTVQVGPFKIPRIKKESNNGFFVKKISLVLTDYKDDTGADTWVKVSRKDPSTEMGLWRWNPFGQRLAKVSRVAYSYDHVGTAGTTLPTGVADVIETPPCCNSLTPGALRVAALPTSGTVPSGHARPVASEDGSGGEGD